MLIYRQDNRVDADNHDHAVHHRIVQKTALGSYGMTIEVVAPDEVEAEESTPGVVRKPIFETETAAMVQSHIAGETTSGWHHHGDRDVYGYVVEGTGTMEYGPRGRQRQECGAGEYFYILPGTIHRDVNPTDEEIVGLVCFVGSGPFVVDVDDPTDG